MLNRPDGWQGVGGFISVGLFSVVAGFMSLLTFDAIAKFADGARETDAVFGWYVGLFLGDGSYGSPKMVRLNRVFSITLIIAGIALIIVGLVKLNSLACKP